MEEGWGFFGKYVDNYDNMLILFRFAMEYNYLLYIIHIVAGELIRFTNKKVCTQITAKQE